MLKIMIIEDEKDHFELMEHAIKKEFPDAVVELCERADLCLERLEEGGVDIIIADYLLAGMTGLQLLEDLKERKIEVPVIMVTGHGDEGLAVKAMKSGAFDYVVKSGSFFELIPELIRKALRDSELKAKMRQAEEQVRESEEKYRAILEGMEEGYYEVDLSGKFTFFNDAMLELGGYSRDGFIGTNYREYSDEDTAEEVYQVYNKVYTTGRPVKGFEWKLRRKDGTKGYVEASVSLTKDSKGDPIGFRGVVRDVTERKLREEEKMRLKEKLQQAQKMEAVATLAGGIAHQFNNALTSITGHTGLLEMEYPQDERIMEYAKAMKQSALRMAHLTSQLLAYARGGKYNPQTMLLSNFVEGTLPIIQHILDPDIRLETDLPPDVMNVEVDRTQMQMVLSALIANSNEAIDPPGRIRISTRNMDLDKEFTKDHPGLKPGPYVCLSIEDDGNGMDEETKNRIFEPFFTTHFMGRGLGMAAVYGIVRNHDGTITVDSEPGKGTVVNIYLPAVEAREEVVLRSETELARGEGTILVIEDEEPLMKMFRQILEMLGYRVLQARTGKEAVEIARTFDGDIDLALLDIKLPDMEGGRVYPLIMEVRPNLKVIVCSGYSIEGPAQEILDAGAQAFIQKPFSISTLAEKLKEVLEGE
jgi:PAS domain S-box-containing protein